MELVSITGLRSALPYIRKFSGKLFVVKVGGEALDSSERVSALIGQLAILHQIGIKFILVHGGGAQVTQLGERLGISSEFINGRRKTSAELIEVLSMVLNGTIRTSILSACRANHVPAVGLSGIDAGLIRATRREPVNVEGVGTVDYGQVGEIVEVDPDVLHTLLDKNFVPLVSSLTADDKGNVLNINADDIANAIAVATGAEKLIFVTKPRGILRDLDDPQTLISELTINELEELEKDGTIHSGMLPKSKAVKGSLRAGVETVHIVSYEIPDSILIEVFTNEGCGTMICQGEPE